MILLSLVFVYFFFYFLSTSNTTFFLMKKKKNRKHEAVHQTGKEAEAQVRAPVGLPQENPPARAQPRPQRGQPGQEVSGPARPNRLQPMSHDDEEFNNRNKSAMKTQSI